MHPHAISIAPPMLRSFPSTQPLSQRLAQELVSPTLAARNRRGRACAHPNARVALSGGVLLESDVGDAGRSLVLTGGAGARGNR
eukprot:12851768-Alexandrium_andersonii.AAC.1